MRYLESYSKKDIEKNFRNLINEHNNMCKLIKDYINFNNSKLDAKEVYTFYFESSLNEIGDEGIIVSYLSNDGADEGVIIYDDDFEDFFEYLEDPGLYKSKKNYNL